MSHLSLLDLAQKSKSAPLSEAEVTQLEQVVAQDRIFFEQHPEEQYYLRPISSIEILEAQAMRTSLDADTWMFVGYLGDGARFRRAFPKGEVPPIQEFDQVREEVLQHRQGQPKQNAAASIRRKAKGFG